jgi:hypothetical protein
MRLDIIFTILQGIRRLIPKSAIYHLPLSGVTKLIKELVDAALFGHPCPRK